MPVAVGLFKQLVYKIETTFGVAAGQAAGQMLRRTKSTLDLAKETYASAEIRTDFQIADFRHGVRSVTGSISGELSPLTYKDVFAVALKRDFAAVTALTAVGLTISGTGPTYTVVRSAGSWFTDNLKIGMVPRFSVGALNALNLNKNLLIVDIANATTMTVLPLNGSAMFAEGPVTGCTVTVIGKVTYTPTTGHTDKSLSIEHWYSDIAQSELFLGCKLSKISLNLPPTGMATIEAEVMGQDLADTAAKRGGIALTTNYFTTPAAVTSSVTLAAVNGVLRVAGVIVATVTGLTMEIAPAYSGEAVVGANTKPALFAGMLAITGQLTAFFDSVTFRDAFVAETEVELIAAFTTDNTATAEFITLTLPRIKLGGSGKDDGQTGLKQTIPYQALLAVNGGAGTKSEKTTLQIQDSLA